MEKDTQWICAGLCRAVTHSGWTNGWLARSISTKHKSCSGWEQVVSESCMQRRILGNRPSRVWHRRDVCNFFHIWRALLLASNEQCAIGNESSRVPTAARREITWCLVWMCSRFGTWTLRTFSVVKSKFAHVSHSMELNLESTKEV